MLTLHPSVTAKEIMQILRKNAQWRISGSMLKIHFPQLAPHAKTPIAWVKELTEQVSALERQKKPHSSGSGQASSEVAKEE